MGGASNKRLGLRGNSRGMLGSQEWSCREHIANKWLTKDPCESITTAVADGPHRTQNSPTSNRHTEINSCDP